MGDLPTYGASDSLGVADHTPEALARAWVSGIEGGNLTAMTSVYEDEGFLCGEVFWGQ
jgi:hypothetical protein